jgi:hypothetical protein
MAAEVRIRARDVERGPLGGCFVEAGVTSRVTSDDSIHTATRAVHSIKEYWRSKGVEIEAWIEPMKCPKRKGELLYVVKTKGIPGSK